jgi:protein-disulfide isomerase
MLVRRIQGGDIQFRAYDLPLPGHGAAIPAAVVANCAREAAPGRFWALRDQLFLHQAAWSASYPVEEPLLALVHPADSAAVRRCMHRTGSARAERLRRSWQAAAAAGVTFTPAYSVNGKVVPWAALDAEIQSALRGTR